MGRVLMGRSIGMIKKVGLALALALVAAPAAYGADRNPWHINVYGAGSVRMNSVRPAAFGAAGNPWHINVYGASSARVNSVRAAAFGVDANPWHINIYRDTSTINGT
jgi:hypothetical protein